MKTASAGLLAHLSGRETSLASCVKITPKSGPVIGLTDLDDDLVISGVTYKAIGGLSRSASDFEASLAPASFSFGGLFAPGVISEADILSRKLEGATIDLFRVNFLNLAQGTLVILKGTLGRITPSIGGYTAEVYGLSRKLETRPVVEVYGSTCAADLADARCQAVISSFPGTITTVTSRKQFIAAGFAAGGSIGTDPTFFDRGKLTFTSGPLSGTSVEVRTYTDGTKTFLLPIPLPASPGVGSTFSVNPGCDKKLSTCRDRFDNVVNFRGFPFIPAADKGAKVPPTLGGGLQGGGTK